ncbi:MAG: DUF2589 domain-containing protein [Chromatiales bacterium]|jgi:hypothetical protein
MAPRVSLNDLIASMANAVIEAQDRIEQHQIANIKRYFDSDNRPVSVHLRMPSLHPDAGEDDMERLRVPLLALVSSNQLKIKEVEISFDAEIGEFDEGEVEEDPAKPKQWKDKGAIKAVKVDMRSGVLKRDRKSAHVVLKVEGGEPTEGMARLIHELNKFI